MSKTPVYAYYFPNWHPDERNDRWHGTGWTEWDVSRCATPRFPGHVQPKMPLWGYLDESEPAVMEKKISTALEYGVDGFIWDMYWFDDGPYRLSALEDGFLQAPNVDDMQFAVMWCNHDPIYVHPASRWNGAQKLQSGDLSAETFITATQHFIDNYFGRANYIRVDGRPLFVLYDLGKLIDGFGGVRATRMALDDLRARAARAGVGELCLAAEVRFVPGVDESDWAQMNETLELLGFDEIVNYAWPFEGGFPTVPYEEFAEAGERQYVEHSRMLDLPVNVTVSNGWDSSPRTVQSDIYEQEAGYPFLSITTGNTPEAYERALRRAKAHLDSDAFTGHFLTLSTWNEWTEGNYLEPCEQYGFGYLEAVRRVFQG